MIRAQTIEEVRAARLDWESVGFVPTMGALHDGHLSLMRRAKESCDKLVVSIFVNPTQFGQGEDLDTYPRDLEGDALLCESVGCDLLFFPDVAEMYSTDARTTVSVSRLSFGLCGASRPGHFDGVTTVVTKLFNIVQPDVAVFGQKDFQQLAIIKKMVDDLDVAIEIIGAPTAREADGLAKSSRNLRLSESFRAEATALSRGLFRARDAFDAGDRSVERLLAIVTEEIARSGNLRADYIEAVHPRTLEPLSGDVGRGGVALAVAIFAGDVRLIDNIVLD